MQRLLLRLAFAPECRRSSTVCETVVCLPVPTRLTILFARATTVHGPGLAMCAPHTIIQAKVSMELSIAGTRCYIEDKSGLLFVSCE